MTWRETRTSDDHGHSAAQPRREEIVWAATDPHDCTWIAAQHDDGVTWNLTRTNQFGELIDGVLGFRTADAAKEHGDQRAVAMVQGG